MKIVFERCRSAWTIFINFGPNGKFYHKRNCFLQTVSKMAVLMHFLLSKFPLSATFVSSTLFSLPGTRLPGISTANPFSLWISIQKVEFSWGFSQTPLSTRIFNPKTSFPYNLNSIAFSNSEIIVSHVFDDLRYIIQTPLERFSMDNKCSTLSCQTVRHNNINNTNNNKTIQQMQQCETKQE